MLLCFGRSVCMVYPARWRADEDHVDQLDPDERYDDAADAVDQHVFAQDGVRAARAVGDASQRERDQRDDDERVEDDRREDRALRRRAGA